MPERAPPKSFIALFITSYNETRNLLFPRMPRKPSAKMTPEERARALGAVVAARRFLFLAALRFPSTEQERLLGKVSQLVTKRKLH